MRNRIFFTIFRQLSLIRLCLSLLFLALCVGCSKPLPELKGIDVSGWKNDVNGCNNQRASMRTAIDREKEKLLGLDEVQIVTLLGSPDQEELYSRNQKFYYYFIEPGPQCATSKDSTAAKLMIRFNAVGLAKEVSIVSGELGAYGPDGYLAPPRRATESRVASRESSVVSRESSVVSRHP
jgi:hypothetical protein